MPSRKSANPTQATVYLKTGERLDEIADSSVRLLMDGSVYLGKKAGWDDYARLYRQIFLVEGLRVLRPDGWLVASQTDEYRDGVVRFKTALLYNLLTEGYDLLDVKVWKRRGMDFFQVPFSVITVWRPHGGRASRSRIKHRPYLDGVWDFPQARGDGNAVFPAPLCDVLLNSFTAPGDLVVDPLAGTGNLLARAVAVGRRAIGYEIDPKWVPALTANGIKVVR